MRIPSRVRIAGTAAEATSGHDIMNVDSSHLEALEVRWKRSLTRLLMARTDVERKRLQQDVDSAERELHQEIRFLLDQTIPPPNVASMNDQQLMSALVDR